MRKAALLLLLLSPFNAFSAGYYTPDIEGTIRWINHETSLVRIALNHPTKLNPDSCKSSSAVVLRINNEYDQAQFSSLLAAMMANKKVRFYVNDCVDGWGTSYPRLHASYIYN